MSDDTRTNKGGRPPKADHKKRRHTLSFTVTDAEFEQLQSYVEDGDYSSRSAYLRDVVLEKARPISTRIPRVNREAVKALGRIGSNINQIATALNSIARNMRDLADNSVGDDSEESAGLAEAVELLEPQIEKLKPTLRRLTSTRRTLAMGLLGRAEDIWG